MGNLPLSMSETDVKQLPDGMGDDNNETFPIFLVNYLKLIDVYDLNKDTVFLFDLWKKFHKVYPDGKVTQTENMKFRGGDERFWKSVFNIADIDKQGYVDFRKYMMFLLISQNQDTEKTLESLFRLMDLNKNGYLEMKEVELIVGVMVNRYNLMMVKLMNHYNKKNSRIDEQMEQLPMKKIENVKEFTKLLFSIFDRNETKMISKNEFVRGCMDNPQIRDMLVNSINQVNILERDRSQKRIIEEYRGGKRVGKKFCENEFLFYEQIMNLCWKKNEKYPSFLLEYLGRETIEKRNRKTRKLENVYFLMFRNSFFEMKKPCYLRFEKKRIYVKVFKKVYGNSSFCNFVSNVFKTKKCNYPDVFINFVSNGIIIRRNLIKHAIKQLNDTMIFVNKYYESFNFNNSDILFMYDSLNDSDHGNLMVKMINIDFSNILGHDEKRNIIFMEKIKTLMSVLKFVIRVPITSKKFKRLSARLSKRACDKLSPV